MNKKAHTKLGDQVKQIKSLLVQFKKARTKCKDLAQQLKVDLPIDALYSNTERTTLMKIQLLDLPGLINLKNSLVKILGQFFDQERQLLYRKQKLQAKAKMGMMQSRNNKSKERKISTQKKNNANSHSRSEPFNNDKVFEDPMDSMRSSRASDLRQSRSFQIPIYKARGQTAQSKMDRISKYIASLKKSMKSNTEAAGSKWRVKDYLLDQPIYLKAKAQLQKYLMRQQQLQRLLAIAVREKLVEHFNNISNKISQDDNYIYVRVDKPKSVHRKKKSPAKDNSSLQKRLHNEATRDHSKKIISQPKLPPAAAAAIQKQVALDFQSMKVELENRSQNYAEMFSKMSEVMEKGNQRLTEIRQKRKEAFQLDDQLWDQL